MDDIESGRIGSEAGTGFVLVQAGSLLAPAARSVKGDERRKVVRRHHHAAAFLLPPGDLTTLEARHTRLARVFLIETASPGPEMRHEGPRCRVVRPACRGGEKSGRGPAAASCLLLSSKASAAPPPFRCSNPSYAALFTPQHLAQVDENQSLNYSPSSRPSYRPRIIRYVRVGLGPGGWKRERAGGCLGARLHVESRERPIQAPPGPSMCMHVGCVCVWLC